MSEMVVATTANPISAVPRRAAASGGSPSSSWCRKAFSSTMIASSTTMPIASVSASSVKLLIENPRKYITANVATMEAGIARPGMTVARKFRRKTKMITTTSAAAISSVSSASRIERLTKVDWSKATSRLTPGGSDCWMRGSSWRIASATSMMLAFDWRMTPMATAGVPL